MFVYKLSHPHHDSLIVEMNFIVEREESDGTQDESGHSAHEKLMFLLYIRRYKNCN